MFDDPALTFTLALLAAVAAQAVAIHLDIPGIVILLATGVLLGPDGLGIVRPDSLGRGLDTIVGLSVAVILFEGGLQLTLDRLRSEAGVIRRLITVGSLITATGGTVAAHAFMGWDWQASAVFGALVIVTGPTVITPLLRRIRVKRNVATILEAEGILNDPIGAIAAAVALEVALTETTGGAIEMLLGLPARLAFGTAAGLLGGVAIAGLLRTERLIPEGIENILTLALVLALFQLSNAVHRESGILAAAVAGLVVGNVRRARVSRELREFKGQLTIMLVGLVFVLLAADVRLADVVAVGWPGIVTVLALIAVVRPLDVLVSTHGSDLDARERTFIAWLAPRGVVAAAVASVFTRRLAEAGLGPGRSFRALVFLVIAVTVVVQGLTGGLVAGALGIRRRLNEGYAIAGANALGRALAHALGLTGEPVVMIESDARAARAAAREGLAVVQGNANDERVLARADAAGRRALLAVTPLEGTNLLVADRARSVGVPQRFAALDRAQRAADPERAAELGARVVFGVPIDLGGWIRAFELGEVEIQALRFTGGRPLNGARLTEIGEHATRRILPLGLVRAGLATPFDERSEIRKDDVAILAVRTEVPGAVRLPHAGAWTRVSLAHVRAGRSA